MRKPPPVLIVGLLLICISHAAQSQTPVDWIDDFRRAVAEGGTSHLFEIDNDTLLLNRNDGFYSSGLRYSQRYAMHGADNTTTYGWRFGQEMYTASDIKLPPEQVGPPNHPYAAWLYGGFFRHMEREDGSHLRLGIDAGCLGPCAGGEWTQRNFHRILDQPLPQGWSRQVRNEIGIVLYADMAGPRWKLGRSVDLTHSVNGRFGNIRTDAGAGLLLRVGRLGGLQSRSTFHGFLRADAHAVAYNATLQGGYFSNDNPHTVRPKRFVGEAALGVAWRDGEYGVTLALVRRSNEIRDLPNSVGAQNFIRLQFLYSP
jgi:lipid A 3-O-deacylase